MRRLGRLAIGLIALGCTPAHLKQGRLDADAKIRAGCATTSECKALHDAALDVLSECQKLTPGKCEKDEARKEATFARLTEAKRLEAEPAPSAEQLEFNRQERERLARARSADEAAAKERADQAAARETAKEAANTQKLATWRARLALGLRMLSRSLSEEEAALTADAIMANVAVPENAPFDDARYEFAAVFARRPGLKPGSASLVPETVSAIATARRECEDLVKESDRWTYRYLSIDKALGSTCGMKQFGPGLPWKPLPETPPEIKKLNREWRGLQSSVSACERGLDPAKVVPGQYQPFACPRPTK
jgi:hypothetical protein